MSRTTKVRLEDIQKKSDQRSLRSEAMLIEAVERRIKKVFVTALKCVEIKFGKDFDGYDTLRAEILREGNDAIRDLREVIKEGYNVEAIPKEVLTVQFGNRGGSDV